MPARNAAAYLRAAMTSVFAQTFRDFELIVVDDQSTDDSREILAGCADRRLVVVRNDEPRGLPRALNRGLHAAKGEVVARQDADDLARPERLERQLRVMQARPELALLGSRGTLIDAGGQRVGRLDRPLGAASIRWYHLFDNPFVHSSVMFRRAVVTKLGGYDESFLTATEDWELWSRVIHAHPVGNLPDRLIDYRVHATSMSGGVALVDRRRDTGRIVEANVRRTLGVALDASETDLLCGFLLGIERREIGGWMALLDRLLAGFDARYPGSRPELARTVATQFDAVVTRARPATRRTALALYAAALRARPAVPWRPALGRAAARLVFGPRGLASLRAAHATRRAERRR
jgi:hypothetical protein